MILALLVIIPALAGLIAWYLGRLGDRWPRWVALAAMANNLVVVSILWAQHFPRVALAGQEPWLVEIDEAWIPGLGIRFHLAMDGLSLLLVGLTALMGIMAVITAWRETRERVGFFHFNLLWTLAGITGVFLALDLFLFYFFWEVMLVPAYLLFLWGYERRIAAAIKFFIFTQAGSLLMLLSILGLSFVHREITGRLTFDYEELLATAPAGPAALLLMLGFFVAFAVKLPVVPLHTWLPDAYVQAPTAGTVILTALMAKTGGYGMLRFVVPLFPDAALAFAPVAMALGVAGILYGAMLAFAQTDLKRLIAYSSISHMGFVVLGVFAWNELALQGAVLQMIVHGISTGALFMLAGALLERTQTGAFARLGGLWSTVPRLSGTMLFFALAAVGLPGLGNFIAEFLVLVGTYQASALFAVLAALGIITAAVYALWMIQQAVHGPNREGWQLADFSRREMASMAVLGAIVVWLGLYPQPVLDTAGQALANLRQFAAVREVEAPGAGGQVRAIKANAAEGGNSR
jgi:NADH-quinone oxidoreductase subunit M